MRHLRAVLAYLIRRTGRPDLAADLAAETFAAALQSLPTYRETGAARGWLFGIANHKLADSARRHAIADRSRKELGMVPVALTDDDLERAAEWSCSEAVVRQRVSRALTTLRRRLAA